MKWEIKETADGQFMVRLIAKNGEPLVWSERYTRREDAARAYRTIRWTALLAGLKRAVS